MMGTKMYSHTPDSIRIVHIRSHFSGGLRLDKKLNYSQIESFLNSSALLSSIDLMGVGLAITNPNLKDNPLVYVNKGFEMITGYSKEEVMMRNLRFLQGEETDKEHLEVIRNAVKQGKAATVTIKNYRKDGTTFWNQFIVSPVYDSDDKPAYFIGLQFDVSDEVEAQQESRQQIRRLSYFDPVTGLLNMGRFTEVAQEELAVLEHEHRTGAVLRVNLNRFRYINESYGEAAGNELLINVAQRIRNEIDENAPVCRSFADEFIIFLNRISDPLQIHTIASKLYDCLKQPFVMANDEINISFAMGVSIFPDDGTDVPVLLKHAELAMKEAKTENISNPHYFDYYLMDLLLERMNMEKKLPRALADGEFELYYQPKINAATMEIIGMEALLRWNDPEEGMISPASFIPIAEESGFIVELGEWVLWEACRTNKRWQDQGLPKLPVSVNVSAVQFRHPQFVQTVGNVLKKTGLAPEFLELEVTESLLNEPALIKDRLDSLKGRGINLSIDDFGTGYSSIFYLKELPLQILKIDRTFIQNTPHSQRDSLLLRSIIQLGKSLGLTVLAEGVETEQQLQFLRENDCDQIQGYFFSRPVNCEAMTRMLEDGNGNQ